MSSTSDPSVALTLAVVEVTAEDRANYGRPTEERVTASFSDVQVVFMAEAGSYRIGDFLEVRITPAEPPLSRRKRRAQREAVSA